MPTEVIAGLPYPASTDPPNGPLAFQNLAVAAAKKGVMAFASAADRTAKLPSPAEGSLSYLANTDQYEGYTSAGWVNISNMLLTAPRGLVKARIIQDNSYLLQNINDSASHTIFTTTAVLEASRAYEVKAKVPMLSTAGLTPTLHIAAGITDGGGLCAFSGPREVSDFNWAVRVEPSCIIVTTSGRTATFTVVAQRIGGSVAYDIKALSTMPFEFSVVDIGASSVVTVT